MANIRPLGFDRLSNGDPDSLIDNAKQQDLERSIRKDEEYCNIYGENKVFSEISEDPCVPCDSSRLDVIQAGTYKKVNQISIINPVAYQAYLNREVKLKKLKEKMELENAGPYLSSRRSAQKLADFSGKDSREVCHFAQHQANDPNCIRG